VGRKIIHIDMDYFFAQVEIRDNPSLKGKPVAIGGSKDRRGVLSTCNYIAREFGVRSALPTYQALQKCPNLIILNGNYSKYSEASTQILEIFKRYTDKIQVVSIDEAYLDVTDSPLFFNSATLMAIDIRRAIFEETGLTASAGVSFNKMLAKISSEINKPDGLCVIDPSNYKKIIPHFEVKLINGVGKVTQKKLQDNGIKTFSDAMMYSKLDLINLLGSFGPSLYQYCRGIDHRDVAVSYERKSLSVERTFERDILDVEELKLKLKYCYEEMIERLKKYSERFIKTIFIKIKYSDFKQTTIEEAITEIDFSTFFNLFLERLQGLSAESEMIEDMKKKVRLIGLGVKFHSESNLGQLSLEL
jgi:DNA polymerase-4